MAPTLYPLLLLLLLLNLTSTSATNHASPPTPARWPDRFHATMFTNLTNTTMASTSPPLRITDLYYDWPRRRNLNLIRYQLSHDPLYDVEWNNGTTFYFDSASCRTEQFTVGILPPGWLAAGEGTVYLGRRITGGIECDVWDKLGFVVYYQEVDTGRPVRWDFLDEFGIQQFVMSFEVGVTLEDSQWQAPAHCFPAGDGSNGSGSGGDDDDEEEESSNSNNDHIESIEDGLDAARLLRRLAGATAF